MLFCTLTNIAYYQTLKLFIINVKKYNMYFFMYLLSYIFFLYIYSAIYIWHFLPGSQKPVPWDFQSDKRLVQEVSGGWQLLDGFRIGADHPEGRASTLNCSPRLHLSLPWEENWSIRLTTNDWVSYALMMKLLPKSKAAQGSVSGEAFREGLELPYAFLTPHPGHLMWTLW